MGVNFSLLRFLSGTVCPVPALPCQTMTCGKLAMKIFPRLQVWDEDHVMAFACVIGPQKEEAGEWKFSIFARSPGVSVMAEESGRSSQPLADRQTPRLKHCCVPLTAAPFLGIGVTLDNMQAKNMTPFPLFFCDCALQ